MAIVLGIALAGALGTLARYYLSGWAQSIGGTSFPYGTLAVNLLGCFLFGFLWTLAEDRLIIPAHVRLIVLTGFMGSLTTFSTYVFETGQRLREGQWGLAAGNMIAENGLGLLLLFAGLMLAQWLKR